MRVEQSFENPASSSRVRAHSDSVRMQPLFRASQVIFLQLTDPEDDSRYASKIVFVSDGNELWIGAPFRDEQEVEIEPGTPVILEVLLPDGIRRFPSEMRRRIAGNPATLVVSWPQDIERIQRRNDVRVEATIPVDLEPLARVADLPRRIEAVTMDLSAGGMRVVTADLLPSNLQVRLRIHLPDSEALLAHGVVLRGELIDEPGDRRRFWAAIRFTAIDERDRRDITKLVFDIQRELLRRGSALE